MAMITQAELYEKELGWALNAVNDLQRASRDGRSARRALKRFGQHEAEGLATHVWAAAEKALEAAKEIAKDRRRQLRRLGKKLCKCGVVLSDEPCPDCAGWGQKKRSRCFMCHGTGRQGSRVHRGGP